MAWPVVIPLVLALASWTGCKSADGGQSGRRALEPTEIEWLSVPRPDEFERAYPSRLDVIEKEGFVLLNCVGRHDGSLGSCRVVEEASTDKRYAKAALKLARYFRAKPVTKSGCVLDGAVVPLKIRFTLLPEAGAENPQR